MRFYIGQIIAYTPRRLSIALASGSKGLPSDKRRPCVVLKVNKNGDPLVAPLTGAIKTSKGNWEIRPGSDDKCWHPVQFVDADDPSVKKEQSPPDTYKREPIVITSNKTESSIQTRIDFPLKPSYVWCGDDGELIEGAGADDDVQFGIVNPWMSIKEDQVATLNNSIKYWKSRK